MTMKPSNENPFNGIVEGMAVYDANGQHIGAVAEVHFGGQQWPDSEEGDSKSAAEDIRRADEQPPDLELAQLFQDQVSEDLAQELLRNGYLRLDSRELTGAAAYLMPGAISEVTGGEIKLVQSLHNLKEWPHSEGRTGNEGKAAR